MNDYLTTRQVLDILKVDRITIYRMLQDGRIKGFKIGQQWRFPLQEVERLVGGTIPQSEPFQPETSTNFPTHCVQTIQDLFSEVGHIRVKPDGKRVTHPGKHALTNPQPAAAISPVMPGSNTSAPRS